MQSVRWRPALAVMCVLAWAVASCAVSLPSRTGPMWNLTNQDNQAFGSANLQGRVVLVTFVYTNCPTVCPLITAQMKKLQDEFKQDGAYAARLAFVSITVDPQRDTPVRLKEYAARMGVDFSGWNWVTGDAAQMEKVWQDFGVVAYMDLATLSTPAATAAHAEHSATSATYEVTHSAKTFLLDKRGNIRAEYIGPDLPLPRVSQDARALMGE